MHNCHTVRASGGAARAVPTDRNETATRSDLPTGTVGGGGRTFMSRRRVFRSREEKGATLVEFALLCPVFCLLLFGMIDFGLAFGDFLQTRSGAREGARLGAVNNVSFTGAGCRIGGAAVTPSTDTQRLVCLTKQRIGVNQDRVRVGIAFPNSTTNVGDPVRVCADVLLQSNTGFTQPFLSGRRSATLTEIRLETNPTFSAFSEGGISC